MSTPLPHQLDMTTTFSRIPVIDKRKTALFENCGTSLLALVPRCATDSDQLGTSAIHTLSYTVILTKNISSTLAIRHEVKVLGANTLHAEL